MIDSNEHRVKSLRHHVDFISVAEARHFIWAADTEDAEISRIHTEIANLYARAIRQSELLIEKYQQPPDAGTAG